MRISQVHKKCKKGWVHDDSCTRVIAIQTKKEMFSYGKHIKEFYKQMSWDSHVETKGKMDSMDNNTTDCFRNINGDMSFMEE